MNVTYRMGIPVYFRRIYTIVFVYYSVLWRIKRIEVYRSYRYRWGITWNSNYSLRTTRSRTAIEASKTGRTRWASGTWWSDWSGWSDSTRTTSWSNCNAQSLATQSDHIHRDRRPAVVTNIWIFIRQIWQQHKQTHTHTHKSTHTSTLLKIYINYDNYDKTESVVKTVHVYQHVWTQHSAPSVQHGTTSNFART